MYLKPFLKALIFVTLMVSVLLRPVMAQMLVVPSDIHKSSQTTSHFQMDGDYCPHMMHAMQSEQHEMPCCAHHHQHFAFSTAQCPDCGDNCDCVKHLHISSSTLETSPELVFIASAQSHHDNSIARITSFIPSTLERPPQSF